MAAAQLSRIACLFGSGLLLADCSVTSQIGKTISPPHEFVATDFCADLMARAYPQASFEVTGRQSSETGLATSIATITAHRTDTQPNTELSEDVAVECSFDHNVLSGFRWTEGPFRGN